MNNSATGDEGGLRERKRTATRSAITAVARTLTAANGVNGFTVEQLCEQVGISRRTFFNYFPAKEDAILGSPADDIPEDLIRRFIDGGKPHAPGRLSDTLGVAFVDLAVGMVERMALSRADMSLLKEAVSAEPRLIQKAMHISKEADDEFARMIAAREGLGQQDVRVQAAVAVFGALVQRAGMRFFAPDNTTPYRSILTEELNAALEVFAACQPVDAEAGPAPDSALPHPATTKDTE